MCCTASQSVTCSSCERKWRGKARRRGEGKKGGEEGRGRGEGKRGGGEGRGRGEGERRERGEGEGEGREGRGKGEKVYFTNLDYRSKAIDFLTIYVASLPSHPLHPHLRDITRRAHSWFPWRPSRSLEKDGQFVAQALLRPNSLPEIHIVMHLQREDREETTASVGR